MFEPLMIYHLVIITGISHVWHFFVVLLTGFHMSTMFDTGHGVVDLISTFNIDILIIITNASCNHTPIELDFSTLTVTCGIIWLITWIVQLGIIISSGRLKIHEHDSSRITPLYRYYMDYCNLSSRAYFTATEMNELTNIKADIILLASNIFLIKFIFKLL